MANKPKIRKERVRIRKSRYYRKAHKMRTKDGKLIKVSGQYVRIRKLMKPKIKDVKVVQDKPVEDVIVEPPKTLQNDKSPVNADPVVQVNNDVNPNSGEQGKA